LADCRTGLQNSRVDPESVTLAPGESATVQAYLIPTATGEHSFALFVKDGATTIATQLIKVNVAGGAAEKTQISGEAAGLLIIAILVLLGIVAYYSRSKETGNRKRETVYY